MKRSLFILSMLFFVAACNPTDDKAKLEKLKKEHVRQQQKLKV